MTTGIYPRWPFPDRLATWEEVAVNQSESSTGVRQCYDLWGGRTRQGWRLGYLSRPTVSEGGTAGLSAVNAFWRARKGPAEAFLMPSFGMEARLSAPALATHATLTVEAYGAITTADLPFSALRFDIVADSNQRLVVNESLTVTSDSDVVITVSAGTYRGFTDISDSLTSRLNASELSGTYAVRTTVTERRFEISSTATFALLGLLRDGDAFSGPDSTSLLGTLGFRNTENRTGERLHTGRRSVGESGNFVALYDPRPSHQSVYGLAAIHTVVGCELGIDPLPTLPTTFEAGTLVEPVTGAAFLRVQRATSHQAPFLNTCEVAIRESPMD